MTLASLITDRPRPLPGADRLEARELLEQGDESTPLPALMAAIAVLCDDPASELEDFVLGLRYPGVVREAAAIELHRRTRRSYPSTPPGIIVDEDDWRRWLRSESGGVQQKAAPGHAQFLINQVEQYGAHNYHPLPVVLTEGHGVWVTDVAGRRYLDMLAGYSALNFGHAHPELVAVAKDQLERLAFTSRAFHTDQLARFCEAVVKLCQRVETATGGDPRRRGAAMEMALPMNTGAEGVETAIKLARKWGYSKKGVPADRAEIIVFSNNFHGRTTTIVGFSTSEQSRRGFGPFTPGFVIVPYGDGDAVRRAVTSNTVAVLVEPIQGEAGVIVPPDGFLRELRGICTDHNVLLVADEIQTGFGRTGTVFACEHEGVAPDVIILGKALGGGLLPISAVVSSRDIMSVFEPGDHGSTFGGNPLACAVACKAIELIDRGEFVTNSARLGAYFADRLRALGSAGIKEVRGRGLMIGVELTAEGGHAHDRCLDLLAEGLLCKDTKETVVRLTPPLMISREEIDWALTRIERVLG